MPTINDCDFPRLHEIVVSQFACSSDSVHGPSHWCRVEQNGKWLARRSGADVLVVRLFAWFHDAKRINDSVDPWHGRRGAEFAASLRGDVYDLDDDAFDRLIYACEWHTDQDHTDDPTIATCWDADRLDLGRVSIIPDASLMNTTFGKQVADAGSFYELLDEGERDERTTLLCI